MEKKKKKSLFLLYVPEVLTTATESYRYQQIKPPKPNKLNGCSNYKQMEELLS